ncbi:MAG: glycosyltransferase family 4 protein [Chloroflexi bacterium]|nr:glycosyltransferase family 4 protein [Chloroflexota bacterium]
MRVLMISKACVVGAYQRKLEEIAQDPAVELSVMVPPFWDDRHRRIDLEEIYTEGYDLIVDPLALNGNFHLYYFPTLRQRIQEIQPDILHIDEEPYNFATYHALRVARWSGTKALFFTWQNILRHYPPPFSQMERWVLHHADYALAGTHDAARIWRDKGYGGPMRVIPQFGVDPDLFSPDGASAATDRSFVIGYAGRLVPEKGLDVLIQAVGMLPGKWHLKLAGGGPQHDELQQMVGLLNIGGSVSFVGPIPSTEMPDFFRSLDVFVLPSLTRPNWKEQFGRVLIEAMACGVPVIASDSGAIPEVLDDSGLVFPEGNVQLLRDALIVLMQNEAFRLHLAKLGRERVLKFFTQEQVAQQTVHAYHEML